MSNVPVDAPKVPVGMPIAPVGARKRPVVASPLVTWRNRRSTRPPAPTSWFLRARPSRCSIGWRADSFTAPTAVASPGCMAVITEVFVCDERRWATTGILAVPPAIATAARSLLRILLRRNISSNAANKPSSRSSMRSSNSARLTSRRRALARQVEGQFGGVFGGQPLFGQPAFFTQAGELPDDCGAGGIDAVTVARVVQRVQHQRLVDQVAGEVFDNAACRRWR